MSHSIVVIVTWFGVLPDYFRYWLLTAKHNSSIDFLMFTDCHVDNPPPNLRVIKTSMEEEVERHRRALGRDIRINGSYKFCDLRPFFGLAYSDYIDGYDFWGYCDIDLAFGDIRKFATDEVLSSCDRVWQYGHLCLFRNDARTNHLMDLDGCIFSLDEILTGEAKYTPEEFSGLNRICQINGIAWHTNIDFADFVISPKNRLELNHGLKSYREQIFYWENGRAFRAYVEDAVIKREEFAYMHWQKRRPQAEIFDREPKSFFVLAQRLVPREPGIPTIDEMQMLNPYVPPEEIRRLERSRKLNRMREVLFGESETRRMWIRQHCDDLFGPKRTYK